MLAKAYAVQPQATLYLVKRKENRCCRRSRFSRIATVVKSQHETFSKQLFLCFRLILKARRIVE